MSPATERPGRVYPSGTVLERWNRIFPPILCAAFAVLGVWSLVVGDYGTGALQFAFSAFWLLMAVWNRRRAAPGGRPIEG
jgi:hypothetical protein